MRLSHLLAPAGAGYAVAVVLAALSFSSADAHAACADDARLFSLQQATAEQAAGGSVDPLTVTPRTFLALNPDLRRIWGDNIRLLDADCAPIEVIEGQPPVKVTAPFGAMMQFFYDAVVRGDDASAAMVIGGFQAQPLPPEAVFTMAQRSGYSPAVVGALTKAASLNAHIPQSNGLNKACVPKDDKDAAPVPLEVSLLDFYWRFGGAVTGTPGQVYLHLSSRGVQMIWHVDSDITVFPEGDIPGYPGQCTYLDYAVVTSTLTQLGFEVVQGEDLSDKEQEAYRKAYLETARSEASDGGDGATPSLFQ